LSNESIATFSLPGPVAEDSCGNAWRTRTAELLRESFLLGLNPDIVHISSLFEGWNQDYVSSIGTLNDKLSVSATLFDLIPYLNQESYLKNNEIREYYLRKIKHLKKANLLLAISEYSRNEAIGSLGINENTIVNISSAVDNSFQSRDISPEEKHGLLESYKIVKPFILCVPGGFDERKNINGLITAFSLLPEELRHSHQLVITGKFQNEPWARISRHIKALGLSEREIIFTGYIPDDDLISFYNICDLFVFPSLFEGFGLPLLEAMSCGAIAIASNTTSLPEIIHRKDALFDPAKPDEIRNMIQKALTDEGFREDLREYEHEQAKKFSWDRSAKKAIAAFENLNQKDSEKSEPLSFGQPQIYQSILSSIKQIDVKVKPTNLDLVKTANCIALNNPISESRQILVDISVLIHGDAKSGIQRVVRSVLLELLKSPPHGYTVNPIYFDDNCFRYATTFINGFLGNRPTSLSDDVVAISRGDIYLGLDLSAHLTKAIHNYLKRLNILGVKLIFVVYDILFAHHPEWWPKGTSKVLLEWLESISEVASGLVCISRSVANEVYDWLDENPPKRAEALPIGYFHLGADIENSAPTLGLPEDAGKIIETLKSGASFLMVGTIEPRKGHGQVLSAFESLWDRSTSVNLIIVGKRGWLVEGLVDRINAHPMLGKHLFWLEGISDEYLDQIYDHSRAVIMASEGEGFGLPIIEAARHEIPLILRDLPVFHEIAGDSASYFEGLAPEALALAIIHWMDQDRLGLTPSSDGIKYITWDQSVSQLKNAIFNQNWYLVWNRENNGNK